MTEPCTDDAISDIERGMQLLVEQLRIAHDENDRLQHIIRELLFCVVHPDGQTMVPHPDTEKAQRIRNVVQEAQKLASRG